jgi:LuxR family maltose regulon positive regulatory protein
MAALLGKLVTAPARAQAVAGARLLRATWTGCCRPSTTRACPSWLAQARRGHGPGAGGALSEHELQVLALLADGRSTRRSPKELVISLDTVKRHVTHVLDKLGAANRAQAVTRARDLGLLR